MRRRLDVWSSPDATELGGMYPCCKRCNGARPAGAATTASHDGHWATARTPCDFPSQDDILTGGWLADNRFA